MVNDLVVVFLGQTSKPVDMLVIPVIAYDNHPVNYLMGGVNTLNYSGDWMELGLKIDQVSANVWPSIGPITLIVIDVDGDSVSFSMISMNKPFWVHKLC